MHKEIPILMSTSMVEANLVGRKTNTRRLSGLDEINEDAGKWGFSRFHDGYTKFCEKHNWVNENYVKCPYGQPGDLLWVRESFLQGFRCDDGSFNIDDKGNYIPFIKYKADGVEFDWYDGTSDFPVEKKPWKPSIHMPKEAARIWAEVLSIRVERVADITNEDAIKEGIEFLGVDDNGPNYKNYLSEYSNCVGKDAEKLSFRSLWQSLNGKPSPIQTKVDGRMRTISYMVYPFDEQAAAKWNGKSIYRGVPLIVITNPWVWVVEYKILSTTGRTDEVVNKIADVF